MANICAIKGHSDLVFEIAKDDTMILREFVSNFENRKELRELFRANPQYVNQYLNGCLLADIDLLIVGQWIAVCIINDLPQSYYEKLFRGDIRVLKFTVYSSLFSVDVPESEYARIHNQIIRVFDIYSSVIANPALLAALRMMNDIRFGLFDFDDFQAVSLNFIGKEHQLLQIARVAVLANKIDLFLDIYAKLKSINGELFMDKIVDFKNLNLNSLQAKSFKIIFEMIQADSDSDINDSNDINHINDIFESDYNLLLFVTKFYAVKHMKLDSSRDLVTFKFVVAENLLQFGFPPNLEIVKQLDHVNNFVDSILSHIKVLDERGIISFIPDLMDFYKIQSRPKYLYHASFEFIDFISNIPNILQLILENGIKFYADGVLESYLNLPNQQIFQFPQSNMKLLGLKTKDHIEKMELIQGRSVGEFFLNCEASLIVSDWINQENAKLKYFEWRTVFVYWLKHRAGDGMGQIRTPEFMEMLKLDFPDETKELFP
jgi:hypothetical protein